MRGISISRYRNGQEYYRVSITFRSRHISLGSTSDASEAGKIFEAGRLALYSEMKLSDWSEGLMSPLPFHRYVSLLNFRINGIYIKNPVFLRKSYFSYFIDPEYELKFDMDDLFYFSSHTIMKRGNHLFVSDYGLQENIVSRYGIKDFAVMGRDYRFVNGDETDFRYSNIMIINRYPGITMRNDGRDKVYSVKIHLNGDWKLGTYPTEVMAAVVYNKALDELKKRGMKPRSQYIYIDSVSAKEYADLYSKLKLPARFTDYLSAYDMKHMS